MSLLIWKTRAVNARLHSRHDILVIALCTVLSGGQTPCRGTGQALH